MINFIPGNGYPTCEWAYSREEVEQMDHALDYTIENC